MSSFCRKNVGVFLTQPGTRNERTCPGGQDGPQRWAPSDTPRALTRKRPSGRRHDEARIEPAEITRMPGGDPLLEAQKVDIDQLVNGAGVKEPQDLRQRQSRRD